MIIRAFAKINIDLKVVGKRADGYHLIESHMQSLPGLYDILDVVESDETLISCSDRSLDCGRDNLVWKALDVMGHKARVHIEKRIPVAAGLGGGSADAAAIVFAFGGSYADAAKIGSDVPFALMAIRHQGFCAAFASGTGTDLFPLQPFKGKIVTLTPDIRVSTPAVYAEFDRLNPVIEAMPSEAPLTPSMRVSIGKQGNDLEAAALSLFPEIRNTLTELGKPHPKYGEPLAVRQSGSGPSCFAVYNEYPENEA